MLLDDPEPVDVPDEAAGAALGAAVVEVELVDESVLDEVLAAAVEESATPSDEDLFGGVLLDAEEYRSEYQPPPFRMKPAPREICRLAVT